ncbi:hypothetical protein KCU91_g8, partial [Aureobasidium melanogenum]
MRCSVAQATERSVAIGGFGNLDGAEVHTVTTLKEAGVCRLQHVRAISAVSSLRYENLEFLQGVASVAGSDEVGALSVAARNSLPANFLLDILILCFWTFLWYILAQISLAASSRVHHKGVGLAIFSLSCFLSWTDPHTINSIAPYVEPKTSYANGLCVSNLSDAGTWVAGIFTPGKLISFRKLLDWVALPPLGSMVERSFSIRDDWPSSAPAYLKELYCCPAIIRYSEELQEGKQKPTTLVATKTTVSKPLALSAPQDTLSRLVSECWPTCLIRARFIPLLRFPSSSPSGLRACQDAFRPLFFFYCFYSVFFLACLYIDLYGGSKALLESRATEDLVEIEIVYCNRSRDSCLVWVFSTLWYRASSAQETRQVFQETRRPTSKVNVSLFRSTQPTLGTKHSEDCLLGTTMTAFATESLLPKFAI